MSLKKIFNHTNRSGSDFIEKKCKNLHKMKTGLDIVQIFISIK